MDEPDRKAAETVERTGGDTRSDERPGHGDDDDPLIRRVLEHRYRLDERLGEGGVGVVYRGVHLRLERPVAIKVLQRTYGEHKPLRLRFEREARAMAALCHPNIVALTDFGVEDGMPYLVMELLEGSTLGELLDREPIEPTRALDIERQVLRALAYAHGEGLAHRDLKPDNVFLQALPDSTDHVRLLDFGLAKFVLDDERDGPQVTVAGLAFGTPAYMAPEQAAGRPSSVQTDVYAAGVLLFELLTGRRPFEGDPAELLRQHILSEPPTLAEMFPDRRPRPELDALLQRALAKNEGKRFADAGEMLDALAALPRDVIAPVEGTAPADPTGATVLAAAGGAPTIAASERAVRAARTRALPLQPVWLIAAAGGALLLLLLGAGFGACVSRCGTDGPTAVVVAAPDGGAWPTPPATKGTTPAKGKGRSKGRASVAPRPPARNPWTAAPVPPVLLRAKQQLDAGQVPRDNTVKALRAHATQHREDPRPYLLLARIYLARRWRSDAIDRYERAWRRDASVRGDPQMLVDLVGLVGHDKVGRRAARSVERIYGAEALPAVDSALAAPELHTKSARRLQALRSTISR